MVDVELLKNIGVMTVGVLIAILAVYLSLKLLGKFAKLAIGIVIFVAVLWLVFSDNSVLRELISLAGKSTFGAFPI